MKRQKRVAVINDVTGFGRCSAAVAQPIISAMKIQCCVMPTAILSVHTGFPNYFLQDYTPYLETYIIVGKKPVLNLMELRQDLLVQKNRSD